MGLPSPPPSPASIPGPQTALLRLSRAEVIAPLQSLVTWLSGLLLCPLVCLWFSQHGAVCVCRVWEPALQHASVCTPGPFYKSAISLTLSKHSSALPKADRPIDLNYWPAQGSAFPLILNEMKVALSSFEHPLSLLDDHTQKVYINFTYMLIIRICFLTTWPITTRFLHSRACFV